MEKRYLVKKQVSHDMVKFYFACLYKIHVAWLTAEGLVHMILFLH